MCFLLPSSELASAATDELNGIQMHANGEIMTDHFRKELGYEGFFASDAGNVGALVGAHVAYNASDAAAIALRAGMDQTMGGGKPHDISLVSGLHCSEGASDIVVVRLRPEDHHARG